MEEETENEDEIEVTNIDEFNSEEFSFSASWIKDFSNKKCGDLKKRIDDLLSNLFNPKGYKLPCLSIHFLRVFYVHGVSILINNASNKPHNLTSIQQVPIIKCRDQGNIELLIRDLSKVTKYLSMNHFYSYQLMRTASITLFSARYFQAERLDIWRLCLENYNKGLEVRLRSTSLLRHYKKEERYKNLQELTNTGGFSLISVTLMPQFTLLAVQTALRNRETPSFFVCEQLVQLAHAHIVQLNIKRCETEVLSNLNEILICTIALENEKAQKEVIDFHELLVSKPVRFFISWMTWCQLSKLTNIMNPALADIDRMLDYLFTDLNENGLVFAETACKLWHKNRYENNKTSRFMCEFVKNYPNLGQRMIDLTEELDLSHEVDDIIEEMCNGNTSLHPADKNWLRWVERRMKNLKRFGAIEKTIKNCLETLFNFLDFGVNRHNEKAWILFHDVIQKATPFMIKEHWEPREDWWLRFHKIEESGIFEERFQLLRQEVLEALRDISY